MHPEKYYQEQKCTELGGVTEYVLSDRTRVDCLTKKYAIEVEFAEKFYEGVGQSLYYSIMTNRKPGIVLVMENGKSDMKYAERLKRIATKYDITVWYVKP